jgi:hypothetical protein
MAESDVTVFDVTTKIYCIEEDLGVKCHITACRKKYT